MTQLQAARKGLVTEAMKLGAPVVSKTYAFTTLGAGARALLHDERHARAVEAVRDDREEDQGARAGGGRLERRRDQHDAEEGDGRRDLPRSAVRLGDLALIGMDTGEDKPDGHPKWFGLANFEPYRRAQAAWLAEQFARPEIASAKFKALFCHIPLFAAKDHPDYPHDGVKIDPLDYAYWSRECHDLWVPILEKAGVQLVVCGHKHRFRFDAPTADRPWAQVVGGGPELGVSVSWKDGRPQERPDAGRFPTVVEGKVENGRLRLVVHDVFNRRVVFDRMIA